MTITGIIIVLYSVAILLGILFLAEDITDMNIEKE